MVELIDAKELPNGYASVFRWENGKCINQLYDDKLNIRKMYNALTLSEKLKSLDDICPEEYQINEKIDEITTVYTMGSTAFEVLGNNRNRSFDFWKANKALFDVATKAVSNNRDMRYQNIQRFYNSWQQAKS